MKLSVVIITHNEEKNIGRCLESVDKLADEIIVVDSFSTDRTELICREKGVTFVQRPWEGFSAAKNFANGLAKGDFILSLDADEALSPDLRENLETLKQNITNDAYSINRLTQYCGKWIRHGGWYPDSKIRLFRRGSCSWTGDVHEELVFKKAPKQGYIKGDILHYSFYSIDNHVKKTTLYAALAAQRDYERGKRYYFLLHGVVKPWFAFNRMYIQKLGFLDGFYGWVIAVISAFEKFFRYAKYQELKRKNKVSSKIRRDLAN